MILPSGENKSMLIVLAAEAWYNKIDWHGTIILIACIC